MSIQAFAKNSLLSKCKNIAYLLLQVMKRQFSPGRPKVFFRYQNEFTHPSFKRFYKTPPLNWANAYSYELAHWINYPAWIDHKPFILEINDHPLSAVSYLNRTIFEPSDMLGHIQDAKKIYMHDLCKKILVPDSGMATTFERYFGASVKDKLSIVKCPGCITKYADISEIEKVKHGVACLASDYELKGVDLILKAWASIHNKKGWLLYLACPNIPLIILKEIQKDTSIVVINKAPLSETEKHHILTNCSITLAPTHIHGGANIVEGMEFGHAVVHFATHSSSYDAVGKKVDVPYHFYSSEYYGIKWKSIVDFKSLLVRDKQDGRFNLVVTDLANTIFSLIDVPENLILMRKISFSAAAGPLSLAERNRLLKAIYLEIIGIN